VALAWWGPDKGDEGPIQVFDGQHKAAAQILLGAQAIPVRIFIRPDVDVLLKTNTNAGDKLKQVAFDSAVKHHLGNTLFNERIIIYREHRKLRSQRSND
jgi:hypothetical protein